ncbi:conjugal transfer protein TraG, partial [Pseudomonas gingeri]|nr:conjugal transfer protein TraG [Pseudomonas gingeri]
MTLYTNDYLEYYLTLVGWLVSNGIWNVLMDSGFFALPFLVIILQEWFNAREDGGGSDLAFAASARI